MKNIQQTEKQLADKLQNVPVPDMDQGWEQMRKLLDQEMPDPAAGAWSGNRKWWWMGITAGLIMLATWLTQQLNDNAVLADKQTAKKRGVNSNNADGNTAQKNNITIKASDLNNKTQNNNEQSQSNNDARNTAVTTDEVKNANGNNSTASNNVTPKENSTVSAIDINDNAKSIANDVAGKRDVANKPAIIRQDIRTRSSYALLKNQNKGVKFHNQRSVANNETNIAPGNKIADKNDVADNQGLIKDPPTTIDQNTINNPATNAITVDAISKLRTADEIGPSILNITLQTETAIFGPAAQFNEINNFQPEQVAVAGKTDKAFAREVRKKSLKADNRRISRSSMRGGSGDMEKELTFAAGLTLPQSFAVGSQHASSYNVNGRNGRITDYLPAPFFQYHINNKLFLQTEFHFQSPQYTQRLLLSRSVDTFANRIYENNVRLEKLYYFNIPFNVYYSPARNFYIGGGLQYSSLLSGVASYENRTSEGQTVLNHNSVARRFNYDSVAAAFSSSEWRYQFDANYYFNRFTLGLRFNQAMTDFIDISGRGYVPATRDRNKSFLLYLRFNIWEERRKN